MSDATPLDKALAAMLAAPDDMAVRLRFFERLADAELFLLLAGEPTSGRIEPRVFDTGDGDVLVVFDGEARLAAFAGPATPYAALPGRDLAPMVAAARTGLAVNLGNHGPETLLSPEEMAWLAEALTAAPDEAVALPAEFHPPAGLPEALLQGLDAKLAAMPGRARCADLAAVVYDTGRRGHLLAFIDAAPGAEAALTRAVGETLTFSGLAAAALDIVFLRGDEPVARRLARVALRFDLPAPPSRADADRPAPGSDPDRPPILR